MTVATASGVGEPLERTYWLTVDGKPRRISIRVEPGEAGVPTHGDGMVYLGLLQMAWRQEASGERLAFQRSELIDLLQWPRNGLSYDRLRTALTRLWGVGLVVSEAMIARDGREYRRSTEARRLITDFRIESGADSPCWIIWGDLVKEAFRLGDFKRLDWQLLLTLDNPMTAQLYRLIDRVTLGGETRWEIGWRTLAVALGMSVEGYARPARFRETIAPHLDALAERGVIDSWDYVRGGNFTVHVTNYLRSELRRVLTDELGVYPDAARQLVAGFDETLIMQQADCLRFRQPPPREPAGYLVKAVREGYELRYPDDEPEAFAALWAVYSPAVQQAYHRAGITLLGTGDSLFDSNADPQAWTVELRAVVRFLLTWGVEPEEVARRL